MRLTEVEAGDGVGSERETGQTAQAAIGGADIRDVRRGADGQVTQREAAEKYGVDDQAWSEVGQIRVNRAAEDAAGTIGKRAGLGRPPRPAR